MCMRLSFLLVLVSAVPVLGAPPYPPVDVPGSLVIVGGGKLPKSVRDEFIKLGGGADTMQLVVIPTAGANAGDAKAAPGFLKPWTDAGIKNVKLFHASDKKQLEDKEFLKPLEEATAVWLDGGDQTRLADAYRGTAVEKALVALLKRGGVIGGTSAGAAVHSDLMITGGTDEAKLGTGFGFLPGIVIDQHFTQRKRLGRLKGTIEKSPEYVGIGIDEATALVLTKGRFLKVLGDNQATVVMAKSATKPMLIEVMKSGSMMDLYQLRRAAHFRAKESFPPAKAAVPVVPKGTLLIVGGGGAGPEIWKTFIEKAGGPDSLLVVITTALEDPIPDNPGEAAALTRNGAKNVKTLHTRDRKVADTEEFSAILKEAKGVWFSGGRQWRFIDAYEGTLTAKRFLEVLERGGVIGGTSAGASIQSEYMPRGHPLGNTVVATEGYERGLGFLPGCAVDQHFFARKRTEDMTGLMKKYPQLLGIGIDEGTAIVVTGSTAEVIGKTKVGFYDYRKPPAAGEQDYVEVKTGEKYDLKNRKPIKGIER